METAKPRSGGNLLLTLLVGRNPRRTLIRIIVLVAVVFITSRYIILPIKVEGPSMLPTFGNGVNFVNALSYVGAGPKRGDIVSIRMAGISIMYVKRVVAVPGESVGFEGGRLLINGEPVEEPYLQLPSDWEREPVVLGPNEYFVVGDNRSMPMANHVFGRVERKRIVGRVILCKNLFASWVR